MRSNAQPEMAKLQRSNVQRNEDLDHRNNADAIGPACSVLPSTMWSSGSGRRLWHTWQRWQAQSDHQLQAFSSTSAHVATSPSTHLASLRVLPTIIGPVHTSHTPGHKHDTHDSHPHLYIPMIDDIMNVARRKETGISLRYILDFGTQPLQRQMLLSARFLHNELPIRLAHRIAELTNGLPEDLSQNIHIRRVRKWYAESYVEMRDFPPIKDEQDVKRFTELLRSAYTRHNPVVPAIAKGVEEWKTGLEAQGVDFAESGVDLQTFLDNFFLSRIAIRFLAGNHVALYEQASMPEDKRQPDRIGLIHTKCKPYEVVMDAVEDARDVCIRTRGDAPNVVVRGSKHLTLPYVPSHLHHMVFEVVKNSLRAVAERFDSLDRPAPDIHVVVATGSEDVTIKVSDQGGGIPRSALQKMWGYLYTTAKSPLPDVDPTDESYQNLPSVLAGYGCGLSLSRMYARYFGGDIQLFSMQGYGTDAFIHLSRLGNDEEPLPGQKAGHQIKTYGPKQAVGTVQRQNKILTP